MKHKNLCNSENQTDHAGHKTASVYFSAKCSSNIRPMRFNERGCYMLYGFYKEVRL